MIANHARIAAAMLTLTFAYVSLTTSANAQIAGTDWRPIDVTGIDGDISEEARLRFETDGKLSGNGGCNGFFGTYEITDDRIAFGPIGATRRACPDPIGQNEFAFLQALEKVRRFEKTKDGLTLFDDSGASLMYLKQADAQ